MQETSELDRARSLEHTRAPGLSNGAYGIGGHLIGSSNPGSSTFGSRAYFEINLIVVNNLKLRN